MINTIMKTKSRKKIVYVAIRQQFNGKQNKLKDIYIRSSIVDKCINNMLCSKMDAIGKI